MAREIMNAPELEMLKGNVKGTPEGEKSAGMEFKRTKLSIDLLNWVLEGNYEAFTACQNSAVKLTPNSFAEIQHYVKDVLVTEDDIYAMQAYLVINDLGKVVKYVQQIEEDFNLQSVDHDELLYEGLKRNPELSETFAGLSSDYQKILLNGLKTKFNMGQFIQSENFPANLMPLEMVDIKSLNYYMIHVLFDIGGAAGHVRNDGSLIITEAYWRNFKYANDCIFKFVFGELSSIEAYDLYLEKRAEMLNLKSNTDEDMAIIKICNLLRISSVDEAKQVKDSYNILPVQVKEMLTRELNKNGIFDNAILLYYAPATLQNAINFFKKENYENPIAEAMKIVLPIFANIYGFVISKNYSEEKRGVCTAFIGDVAETAKIPHDLVNVTFDFTEVSGNYEVICVPLEKIHVRQKSEINIPGKNILLVAMGGGSDCIQSAMIGKYILSNCNNIISIRTDVTKSQNENGEIYQKREIYNPKRIIEKNVYLCDQNTFGEGRFFENLPQKLGMNVYLIIDTEYEDLSNKIESVIKDIKKQTNIKIDTIIGVDTGGDSLERPSADEYNTPGSDWNTMCAIESLWLGYSVYNCIVAPGIDSPNGFTSEILEEADAFAYYPSESEKNNILKTYSDWNMDGSDPKCFGKTQLIWKSALEGKRGLVTLNIPTQNVLHEQNPWIPTVAINDIMESIVFMETSNCVYALLS